MAIAIENVDKLIYTTLSTDTALAAKIPGGIHQDIAPQGTPMPFIIVSVNDASDTSVLGTGQARIMSNFSYLVKVVTKSASYASCYKIMARADELLTAATGDKVDGFWRESQVRYTENDGDIRYNHYGGIYRINAYD